MRRILLVAVGPVIVACGHTDAAPPALPVTPVATAAPTAVAVAEAPAVTWPDGLSAVMADHGLPHVQPMSLTPDAAGHDRWLAFVGPTSVALGAWTVTRGAGGATATPAPQWPAAVRVLGGTTEGGATYVLLETLGELDQPAGLHGVWIDAGGGRSPFEASPLALAGVNDLDELTARLHTPIAIGLPDRNAMALLATLRAAAPSASALARSLASEGADVGVVWQSMFVQTTAHLDGQGAAPSPVADHVLAVVHGALETQACGADACEAWTDTHHAVVRFVVQGGRWVIRSVLEDAQPSAATSTGPARAVPASATATATAELLAARASHVDRVAGEAPLAEQGGTIGVASSDLAPGVPIVAVREGSASRLFVADLVPAHHGPGSTTWDVAFADVDGDGRTDVILRTTPAAPTEAVPTRAQAPWTQVLLAPPPSVQAVRLRTDLASSLAVFDAPDLDTAVRLATTGGARGVARDEACKLLVAASTPAGFRRVASPEGRVLRFDQPGLPTWHAKIVAASKVTSDDVRDLGAHCAELACDAARPYCAWSGGTDSQHFWFDAPGGHLEILGAADYDGE